MWKLTLTLTCFCLWCSLLAELQAWIPHVLCWICCGRPVKLAVCPTAGKPCLAALRPAQSSASVCFPAVLQRKHQHQHQHHGTDYTVHTAVLPYHLDHCARTCHSRHIITRCRFITNWPIRCKRSAKPLAFTSHVVLFWSWLPRCRRWADLVDSEIQRKIYMQHTRDFSVKRLQASQFLSSQI